MTTSKENIHGAGPLPKGKRKPGAPLFKKPKVKDENPKRDITGQTATTLKQLKQRLAELPKKSSASKSDKTAYEK